jgi:nucleoside-diphosphate-sugar epimerase
LRALVTGGAGFIGSHLVDALLARGDEVVVLDNLVNGRRNNLPAFVELVEDDVARPGAVATAARGCEVIYHQAALGSVGRSIERPLDSDSANVHGTLAVLDAARREGVRRVVVASSSAVYGGAGPLPTPETAPLSPRSPYAVTKAAGEGYARVFWEVHGLETVCLRYFNVYGPRQRPDSPYAAVIPRFIDAVLHGTAPRVHGDGLQTRDFTFVSDAVRANVVAGTEAPADACAGRTFNIACGTPCSVLDVLDILADEVGSTVAPVHEASRTGDVRRSHADVGAARRALGYEPSVDLRTGLGLTLAWFAAGAANRGSRP